MAGNLAQIRNSRPIQADFDARQPNDFSHIDVSLLSLSLWVGGSSTPVTASRILVLPLLAIPQPRFAELAGALREKPENV